MCASGVLDCHERVIQCFKVVPVSIHYWPFDLRFRGREWRQRCKGGTGSVCAADRMNVWKSQFTIVLENHDFLYEKLFSINDCMLHDVTISVWLTVIASRKGYKGAIMLICVNLRILFYGKRFTFLSASKTDIMKYFVFPIREKILIILCDMQ